MNAAVNSWRIWMADFINDFLTSNMTYTSWTYFVLVLFIFILYYAVPKRAQWAVLLAGSTLFYYLAAGRDRKVCLVFALTIAISYIGGLILERNRSRILRGVFLIASIGPLLLVKGNVFIGRNLPGSGLKTLIVPLGLSFYSLQIYSYLFDVYEGKVSPQRNFFKYFLFISYFPHIMQGPIPRYKDLKDQLFGGHSFDADRAVRGLQLVLWGFFLKYMIAEKAAVFVNAVFGRYEMYQGVFALIAGILYSIQLYADFLACVCMCRGVSEALGIELAENFKQPYLSRSIQEFWRKWHMSLSSWLRDYVYIPLGGSRKGKMRKYVNLILTFLVSGAWHGNGYRFVLWGLLHAVYQILGDVLRPVNKRIKRLSGIRPDSTLEIYIDRGVTFFLVMLGWIIFRANSIKASLTMIRSIFTVHNWWVLFDDSLLSLGLDWRNFVILLLSIHIMFKAEAAQQRTVIRDRIMRQPLIFRWILYLTAIAVIIVFGTYGFGYNASDFIYKGF